MLRNPQRKAWNHHEKTGDRALSPSGGRYLAAGELPGRGAREHSDRFTPRPERSFLKKLGDEIDSTVAECAARTVFRHCPQKRRFQANIILKQGKLGITIEKTGVRALSPSAVAVAI